MLDLSGLLGGDRIRRPLGREFSIAETVVEPASVDELAALVSKCEAEGITLAPLGAGRTFAQLRARPVAIGVSLTRIAGVVAYEPEDMTVVVRAGTRLGELNQQLATRRQRLPLDPAHPELSTIGSLIGAAQSGPLGHSEGTARDLLIGVQFVGAGGKAVRGGGRVVKNVAGYDLMKVLTGSYGTLGIVTEAVFKVRPMPESYELAIARFETAAAAFEAAARMHDELPLAHLEVLSPPASAKFGHRGKHLVLAGLSGSAPEVAYLRDRVARQSASLEVRDGSDAHRLYESLRDFEFDSAPLTGLLAVPPAELWPCLETLGAGFCARAGVGVAQVAWADALHADDAIALVARWRRAAAAVRGHLRLLTVSPDLRGRLTIFDSPNPGALKLMQRMKAAFDPAGIFNPGCFVGGL